MTPIEEAEMDRLFTYHPPTDEKAARHKAVNDAAAELSLAVVYVASVLDPYKQPQATQAELFGIIGTKTRTLYRAIMDNCPGSADRSAALRCVRLVRNELNGWVTGGGAGLSSRAMLKYEIRKARYQANSAIALEKPKQLPVTPPAETNLCPGSGKPAHKNRANGLNCGHCRQTFTFSEANLEEVEANLEEVETCPPWNRYTAPEHAKVTR